jgi:hypothetical protein
MKRALLFGLMAAALVVFVAATPASAETVVRESTCSYTHGSNSLTYDCSFNASNYEVGTPVTFTVNYSCSGPCGPVTSFGLRESGFTPDGVSGRLVGAKRMSNAVELTFVFDSLKKTGKTSVGNAHFKLNLSMDDGTGSWSTVPCDVDVHLRQ